MGRAPDRLVQEAFVAPTSEIVRRIEIYEFDAVTPWKPELWHRLLVGGTVSVDMSRDERRSVDVDLDNHDGVLNPAPGGLWYDKVLKVFYGIRLHQKERAPRVAIVEEHESIGQGLALKSLLAQAGAKVAFYNPQIVSYAEIEDFDILVSIASTRTQKLALLTEAFNRGKSIVTLGADATSAQLPLIVGGSSAGLASDPGVRDYEKTGLTSQAMLGWEPEWTLAGPQSYRRITAAAAGTQVLANTWDETNGFSPGILYRPGADGQGWLHLVQNRFDAAAIESEYASLVGFVRTMLQVLDYYTPEPVWEMQIGEFVPDAIEDADDYGDRIRFTGRDYTKRCLGSKLRKATTFTAEQRIEDVIRALALNARCSKIELPTTGQTLGKAMTWERDTDRWSIMNDIALANNYELYFAPDGFLTMRKQQDPLLTPPTLVLTTGTGGNLISRGAKTGDSNLFNVVTVIGESSDTTIPLVYGEAVNDSPNSPSSVSAIGERTKNISSPLVTSEAQARELAETMLSVSSLEEFELDFQAVLFPWIEAGEIVEMGATDESYWGPTRYMISSLNLPLDLSPMSGNGKRVTKVA